MRTIRLEIQYDGKRYFGWQRQAGFPTVQEKVEEAVRQATGESASVQAAGRTDTGVHALRQVAHFRTGTRLDDGTLLRALNAYLPKDIAVRRCEAAPSRFHARFDAVAKRYLYVVRASPIPSPIGREYAHWVPYRLDLAKMRQAASLFLGTHDFRSFAGTEKVVRHSRRTVSSFKIFRSKDLFLFMVEGDGFLLHMVRAMVGTLIEVGRGKLPPSRIREILSAKDRRAAGPTAPACGLYLFRVAYGPPGARGNRKRVADSPES